MSYQKYAPTTYGKFSSSNIWSGIKATSYVKGLLTGTKWGDLNPDNGGKTKLLYYLSKKGDIFKNNQIKIKPVNILNYEKNAIKNAMKAFSDVANISFQKTTNKKKANIKWAILNNKDSDGYAGWAYLPDGYSLSGLSTVNYEVYEEYGSKSLKPGSYDFITYTHELGHALGLGHPHGKNNSYGKFPGVSSDKDFGAHKLNGSPWTVMTYNQTNKKGKYNPKYAQFDGFSTNIGAFDIAAIQYIYGANKTKNKGNNIYKLNNKLNGFQCIWDTGGIDVIDASEASGSSTINLKNATLEKQKGGGGFISQINGKFKGYTIAYKTKDKDINCIIENAIGSKFNDQIIGNNAKNSLNGGFGDDILLGGLGNDKLIGGEGKDIFKLSTGKGFDLIQDFKNKEDKIFIGSIKKLKLKNKGKDTYIYKSKDLLAKVKGAKGLLSKEGKFLV